MARKTGNDAGPPVVSTTDMTITAARSRTEPLPDGLSLYMEEMGRYDLLTADEEVELAQEIEAGRQAALRLDEGDHDGPKEAAELRRAVRTGTLAKDRFIASNLRLVVANARRAGTAIAPGDRYVGIPDEADSDSSLQASWMSSSSSLR